MQVYSSVDCGSYSIKLSVPEKVLILSKMWTEHRPMQFIRKIASNVRVAIQQQAATAGIIVTKENVLPIKMQNIEEDVRMMTLKEFRTYIRNNFD